MAYAGELPRGDRTPEIEETASLEFDDPEIGLTGLILITNPEVAALRRAEELFGDALAYEEKDLMGLAYNNIRSAEQLLAGLDLVNGSQLLAISIEEARARIEVAIASRAGEWPMPPDRSNEITLEMRRNILDQWETPGGATG